MGQSREVIVQFPMAGDVQSFVNVVYRVELEDLPSEFGCAKRLLAFEEINAQPTEDMPVLHKGFFDTHLHAMPLGSTSQELCLKNIKSVDALLDALRGRCADSSGVLRAFGWDQSHWEQQDSQWLNHLEKELPEVRPMCLFRVCGHAALVNRSFKELIGEPEWPTLLDDRFMEELRSKPALRHSHQELKEAFLHAQHLLLSVGVSAIADMSLEDRHVDVYRELCEEGRLLIDVEGVLLDGAAAQWEQRGPFYFENSVAKGPLGKKALFAVRHWKRYLDGSLGARTAFLRQPYADADTAGMRLYDTDELCHSALTALRKGFALSFHAIGDGALAQVLEVGRRLDKPMIDSLEAALRGPFPLKFLRHRIEHCQILDDRLLEELGGQELWQAYLQPSHRVLDEPFSHSRLGKQRLEEQSYRAASLLKAKLPFSLSTDSPIADYSPSSVLRAACQHPALVERLSFHQAIWAYTQGARLSNGWDSGLISVNSMVFLTEARSAYGS